MMVVEVMRAIVNCVFRRGGGNAVRGERNVCWKLMEEVCSKIRQS